MEQPTRGAGRYASNGQEAAGTLGLEGQRGAPAGKSLHLQQHPAEMGARAGGGGGLGGGEEEGGTRLLPSATLPPSSHQHLSPARPSREPGDPAGSQGNNVAPQPEHRASQEGLRAQREPPGDKLPQSPWVPSQRTQAEPWFGPRRAGWGRLCTPKVGSWGGPGCSQGSTWEERTPTGRRPEDTQSVPTAAGLSLLPASEAGMAAGGKINASNSRDSPESPVSRRPLSLPVCSWALGTSPQAAVTQSSISHTLGVQPSYSQSRILRT